MKRTIPIILLVFISMATLACAEQVTITFWHIWTGERLVLVDEVIDRFEREYPNIKVEHQLLTPGSLHDKIVVSALGDNPPDVVMVGGDAAQLGREGVLLSLNEFVAEDELELDQIFYPFVLPLMMDGHDYYYFPQLGGPSGNLLYYNIDMFNEVGLDASAPPETWSQLTQYSRKLIEFDGDHLVRMPIDVRGFPTLGLNVIEWMASNGVKMWDQEGNVLFNTPDAVAAVQWMLDFTNEINGGVSSLNQFYRGAGGDHEAAFVQERAAMSVCGPWLWYRTQQYMVNTAIALRPHNDKGFASTSSAGWGYGISRNSKNKEAAWEFVKWLTIEADGGGWFTFEQSRPSAVIEFNRSPDYFTQNPYWGAIIQGFETSQPLYNAPAAYEEPFKDLVKKVMNMEWTPREGVEETARQLQRMFDEWNQ